MNPLWIWAGIELIGKVVHEIGKERERKERERRERIIRNTIIISIIVLLIVMAGILLHRYCSFF